MLTCPVELQGREDLRGLQLHPQPRDIKTSGIGLRVDALQEDGPGSADQVHQGVLVVKEEQREIREKA